MPRLMSVTYTKDAVYRRAKTVTRRKGWWEDKHDRRLLKPGDHLTLCEKVMGRKPGEELVRIADVEVVDVRRELLEEITDEEVALEGFPGMSREEFMERFFLAAQGIQPGDEITRIQWVYV